MKFLKISILVTIAFFSNEYIKAQPSDDKTMFLSDTIPLNQPISFLPNLVSDNMLIHRGVFSREMEEYYFTVSDKQFSQFDVKVTHKLDNGWSDPQDAFFNSKYNEHGMSFSPDGKTLFFSSTRPVAGFPDTWHIWKSEKQDGKWSDPEFVNLSDIQNKLASHPSVTHDGTLYFHSSNLDYSEMDIYAAKLINGRYQNAKRVDVKTGLANGNCTPYISSDGRYLIFATIGEELKLNISFRKNNEWQAAQELSAQINQNGQGNPYVTPDGKYLFYAAENVSKEKGWNVMWVSTSEFLK